MASEARRFIAFRGSEVLLALPEVMSYGVGHGSQIVRGDFHKSWESPPRSTLTFVTSHQLYIRLEVSLASSMCAFQKALPFAVLHRAECHQSKELSVKQSQLLKSATAKVVPTDCVVHLPIPRANVDLVTRHA